VALFLKEAIMEFKWSVNKVTVAEDNLIVQVDLVVNGTDGKNMASAVYSRNLTRGSLFTPYDQLTEAQVLAWCFEPIVTSTINLFDNTVDTVTRLIKDEGETQVAGQIARQLAQQKSEPALPWVKTIA
jgi:hypothetical protein